MGRLFNLKEWLTVADAAKHLSIVIGEVVTEADVFRLGLDGRLTLSIYFADKQTAKLATFTPLSLVDLPGFEMVTVLIDGLSVEDQEKFLSTHCDEIIYIQGLFDVPMLMGTRLEVERKYQSIVNGFEGELNNYDGVIVQRGEKTFELCEQYLDSFRVSIEKADEMGLTIRQLNAMDNYYPSSCFPKNALYVVRTSVLSEFENALAGSVSKPESTRKTENLLQALVSIATDAYGYDPKSEKSTAPRDIADALSKQGVTFDPKTIRGWLKEGADLLPSKPHRT